MGTMIGLKGLTWDHRRAIDPMIAAAKAFAEQRPDVDIAWDVQPLSGFEFRPIDDIVRDYDLLVFDHPHVGHAAEAGLLRPLDHLLPRDTFIGPSLATYRWQEALWAVPIDAACQTACYRPDLLPEGPPATWSELMAMAGRRRLACGLKGVHAFMCFLTLAANLGDPSKQEKAGPLVRCETAATVLAMLRELAAACPPEALDWNSIALQDAMRARDDLAYCPLVYGFATYAEADRVPQLAYTDIPDAGGLGPVGSTIGGAGLGVSAETREADAAEAFAAFMAEGAIQCCIVARCHGQPAHRDAWDDPEIDARFGGFFTATRRTIEAGAIRPRHAGYMTLQAAAGPLIEGHLRGEIAEATVLAGLGIA